MTAAALGAPRRRSAWWLGALTVTATVPMLLSPACDRQEQGEAPRPNVILLTVDTLRADRLGAYGYAQARTPVLDELAARGTVFLQATTPFPRTTPALASLMTGLWPQHHGSREVSQAMLPVESLSTLLERRGYFTVGVTANNVVGKEQGFGRGFDKFAVARKPEGRLGSRVTERSLELVARRRRKPLFLWAHYLDPHFPYRPPSSWEGQPEAPRCREAGDEAATGPLAMGAVQANQGGRAAAALLDCSLLYDEEIAYTDFEIGRLLAGLEELGLLAGAIVVVTSDHGENLGEEGLYYEHGPSLHDASLRVPLIFVGPGIVARRDAGVARLEDVAPTLLALLGVERAEWPRMDGVDLSPRLAGDAESGPRASVAEGGSALHHQIHSFLRSGRRDGLACTNGPRLSLCGGPGEEPGLFEPAIDPQLSVDLSGSYLQERRRLEEVASRWAVEQARQRAVRIPGFKLVERPTPEGGYRRTLYDLGADPGESVDASADFPEVRAELDRLLDAWTSALPEAASHERSAEELESLRALGYLQ